MHMSFMSSKSNTEHKTEYVYAVYSWMREISSLLLLEDQPPAHRLVSVLPQLLCFFSLKFLNVNNYLF